VDELKILNTLVITIEPLEQICQHMCGEYYVTSSTIYSIYLTITDKLSFSDNVKEESENDNRYRDINYALSNEIKQIICQCLKEKYDKPEIKNIIQTATFLDPRFKSNYFPEETINLVNKIKSEIMEL